MNHMQLNCINTKIHHHTVEMKATLMISKLKSVFLSFNLLKDSPMLSHRKYSVVECWVDRKPHCSRAKLYKHMYILYVCVYVGTHTLAFGVPCSLLPGVSGLKVLLVLSRSWSTVIQTSSVIIFHVCCHFSLLLSNNMPILPHLSS